MDNCTDDDGDDDDGQRFYINDSRDSAKHTYVNVELEPRRRVTDVRNDAHMLNVFSVALKVFTKESFVFFPKILNLEAKLTCL